MFFELKATDSIDIRISRGLHTIYLWCDSYQATAQTSAEGIRPTLGFCKPLAPTPIAIEFRLAMILFQARTAVGLPSYLPGRQPALNERPDYRNSFGS